jgi:hypothetical protein
MKRVHGISLVMLGFLLASPSLALIGGGFDMTWNTVDGGGGSSSGGGFTLSGTVGQSDASAVANMTGGTYSLTGGFWSVTLPLCTLFVAPDFDHDCDVDADDLAHLRSCTLGSGVPQDSSVCADARLDGDDDVDMDDFGVFQRCYSGQNHPAHPSCAQ